VRRKSIRPTKTAPPLVRSNVELLSLPVGRQTLYFLPDRLLVVERGGGIGAVSYESLSVNRAPSRFIEDGSVPVDAKVVDRTWKYVNKKGGPDKRFKDNRELPIVLYEAMHFSSSSGLNELIQLSKLDAGADFQVAVEALGRLPRGADESTQRLTTA
jgi:hypothetical protein